MAAATAVTAIEDFPGALVRARIHKGLDQKEVGELLGVTQGTVSKWERGIDRPSDTNHEKLALFLDTNVLTLSAMIEAPPGRLTQIGQELHRLVDELLDAAREGRL